jgi:hypothetical protein
VEEHVIMAILWLGFMSLFLFALAIPLVQRFMYSAGHNGLIGEIVEGFVAFMLEVLIFSGFLGIVGYLAFGATGAVTLGLTGLTVSFILVGILGTFSAMREWRMSRIN